MAFNDLEDDEDIGGGSDYAAPPRQAIPVARTPPREPVPGTSGDASSYLVGLPPMQPENKQGALKTFGDQVWASTLQMGEGALGFVSAATRALTSDPDAVQWIERQKATVAEHAERTITSLSPEAQQAMRASLFGGKDAQGQDLPSPGEAGWARYLGANAAGMVPQIALAMLPGGIIGRIVSATMFGAVDAGEAYNHMVDAVDHASPDELTRSPVYQHLREQGVSDIEARKQLVAKVAPAFVAARFGVGTVAGSSIGGILTRGAVGTAGRGVAARAAIGAGEGALVMGGQAGADTALEQGGDIKTGIRTEFDPVELARRVASGVVGGAAIGAVGGVLHNPRGRRGAPERAPEPETPPPPGVAPDAHAAMTEALRTPDDAVRQAMTSQPAGVGANGQSEMFQPFEVDPAAPKPVAGMPEQAAQPDMFPAPQVDPTAQPVGPVPASSPTAEVAAPATVPTTPAVPPVAPPATSMSRTELIDALAQLGVSQQTLKRMSKGDLAARFDREQARAGSTTIVPEQPAPAAPQEPAPLPTPGAEVSPAPTVVGELPLPAPTVDEAAARARESTPAQAEAGNYQKGHTTVGGLSVAIETPRGGVRRGVGADGKPWETTMPHHYGYIKRTTGADGDHLDVTLGHHADTAAQHPVYVVDQIDPKTRTFDEHKALAGFASKEEALAAYDASFSDGSGPKRRGAVSEMSFDKFKEWSTSGDTKAPIAWKPTVSDRLRARRAAEKAKLAKPGERRQGTVATVEAPAETRAPVSDREPRTHSEAMQDMRDAVHVAARDIVPLKKSDIEPAIRKVMRELSDLMGETKTEGDILENIARWGRKDANPIGGTRTRRAEVADKVLRLMTGRSLDEFSGRAERVRRELRGEPKPPSVFETEGMTRTAGREAAHAREQDAARQADIDQGAEQPVRASEGVTDYSGTERTRSTATTDLARTGSDLLHDVLAGTKTVHEAHAEFGVQKPGRGGQRRWRDFATYLDSRIAHAEDPAVASELRELLIKNDGETHGQAKSAETERVSRLMEETGKERADQLRKLKAELDPVGAAVEPKKRAGDVLREWLAARRAQPLEQRAIGEAAGRYVETSQSLKANRFIRDKIEAAREAGDTTKLHDLLRSIQDDPGVRGSMQPLRALAARLLRIAPNLDVLTPEQAVRRGLPLKDYFRFYTGEVEGRYERPGDDTAHIIVNTGPGVNGHVETVLHETMHSITADYIDRLQRRDANHADLKALDLIAREIQAAGSEHLPGTTLRDTLEAALSNRHELHTMLMTSPELHTWLRGLRASDELRSGLRTLGFDPGGPGRSVWQQFTGWIRKVLGLGGREQGALLDQLLRPLQDITDRAADYNTRLLPEDRELRGYAEPLYKTSTSALKNALRSTSDHVDPAGLSDKLRRAWLLGATTDGIVKWNRSLFQPSDRLALKENPLVRYRAAQEAIGHSFREVSDKYGDRVQDLTKRLQGPDQVELASLMNDATIAGAKLGTASVDDASAALRSRFDALSPEAKATYRAVRDHYAETYRQERDAQLSALVRTALPDATEAQTTELTSALRTMKGIDELLAVSDDHSVAKAFGTAWDTHRALVKGVAKIHRLGFVQGDYFPLRRFGDYVIRYGSGEEGTYGVEMFERRGQAEARRAELLQQGTEDLSQVMDRRTSSLRDIVPDSNLVTEMHNAMQGRADLKPHADELRDLVNSILLEHATRSEAARTRMRRKGVQGASADASRVLAREFLALGTRLGYLEHGADRRQALTDMRLVADDLGRHGEAGEQIRAQAVLSELEKRLATGDDAHGGLVTAMRRASTFGYVQSLMSPSHALVNTIEIHMNSTSMLGARHGLGRSGLALSKALADISPKLLATGARNTLKAVGQGLKRADWNLAHLARDRLIAGGADRAAMTNLFERLDAAGLVDHTMVREMQRIANPSGFSTSKLGSAWDRFLDFNAAGTHAVDVANKVAVAKAAYDLELRKGGDHAAAAEYAIDTLRQVTPNYNLGNKARISTDRGPLGGFAGPLTQFKQYGIHMYSLMANLARSSVHGASREERREARKAFAGIIGTHAMMAGVMTLIADPLRFVGGAYDFVTGASRPHDYQADIRGWMSDLMGPEIGEIVARGIPHAAGFDIHRRVGLNNMIELPELKSFDKKGVLEAMATAMTGAAGDDAATMVGGLGKMLRGDILEGVQDMVPRVVRDPLKAMKLADKGVTDSRGKVILPADKLSTADVAWQAAGFQPSRVSEFREGRFAVQQARQEAVEEHARLTKAWLDADPTDKAAVMSEIRTWNADNHTMRITVEQLARMRHQRQVQQGRSAQTFGLTLPKRAAATFAGQGRFANYQ